jgi:DNA topoisomerase-1
MPIPSAEEISNANDCHDERGQFCETGGAGSSARSPSPETAKHAATNPKTGGRVDPIKAPTSFRSSDGEIDFSKTSEKDIASHFAKNYHAEIEIPGMTDPEVRSRFCLQVDKILSDFQGTGVIQGSQSDVRILCPTKEDWDNAKTGFGQPEFPKESGAWMVTDSRGWRMSLNPYAMSDMPFMESEFAKGTEWHAEGVYNFEGAVTHEMGHMLENSLKWNHDTITGYYTGTKGEIGSAVENYIEDNSDASEFCPEATRNRSERFAEAFAAHYHGTPEAKTTSAVSKMSTIIDWTKNGVSREKSKYYKEAEHPKAELAKINAELARVVIPKESAKTHMNECHEEDSGRFCETGGSTSGGTSRGGAWQSAQRDTEGRLAGVPTHIEALRVPPAWTNVRYDPSPDADLLLTGVDKKGKTQYVYSQRYVDTQKQAKFDQVQALSRDFDDLRAKNEENRFVSSTKENADCMHLIMETGIRPGSDRDTHAEKKAYGATTLLGQHVVQSGEGVRLQYTGKKGVSLDIPIENPDTARMLTSRAGEAGPDGRLFNTSAASLLDYSHTLGSGQFRTKDFRTYIGTSEAKGLVAQMPAPTSKTAFRKAVSSVAKAVAKRLGNTPSIALKSYIAPEVFIQWQTKETGFAHMASEGIFDFDIHVGTACAIEEQSRPLREDVWDDDMGDDVDVPCPTDVEMALGFDPDEIFSNQEGGQCPADQVAENQEAARVAARGQAGRNQAGGSGDCTDGTCLFCDCEVTDCGNS